MEISSSGIARRCRPASPDFRIPRRHAPLSPGRRCPFDAFQRFGKGFSAFDPSLDFHQPFNDVALFSRPSITTPRFSHDGNARLPGGWPSCGQTVAEAISRRIWRRIGTCRPVSADRAPPGRSGMKPSERSTLASLTRKRSGNQSRAKDEAPRTTVNEGGIETLQEFRATCPTRMIIKETAPKATTKAMAGYTRAATIFRANAAVPGNSRPGG